MHVPSCTAFGIPMRDVHGRCEGGVSSSEAIAHAPSLSYTHKTEYLFPDEFRVETTVIFLGHGMPELHKQLLDRYQRLCNDI